MQSIRRYFDNRFTTKQTLIARAKNVELREQKAILTGEIRLLKLSEAHLNDKVLSLEKERTELLEERAKLLDDMKYLLEQALKSQSEYAEAQRTIMDLEDEKKQAKVREEKSTQLIASLETQLDKANAENRQIGIVCLIAIC